VCNVPDKVITIVKLPVIGLSYCNSIRKLLNSLNSKVNKHLRLRFIFVNNFTVRSLFPYKDRVPKFIRSHVIYRVSCACSSSYIGLTKRQLRIRLCEHKTASSGVRFSSISEHCTQTKHDIAWDDVEVLASDPIDSNLYYLESLLISKFKPTLNNRQSSVTLNLFH
jgi:hypothetical protein